MRVCLSLTLTHSQTLRKIRFQSAEAAKKAISVFNGVPFYGRPMFIRLDRPRHQTANLRSGSRDTFSNQIFVGNVRAVGGAKLWCSSPWRSTGWSWRSYSAKSDRLCGQECLSIQMENPKDAAVSPLNPTSLHHWPSVG